MSMRHDISSCATGRAWSAPASWVRSNSISGARVWTTWSAPIVSSSISTPTPRCLSREPDRRRAGCVKRSRNTGSRVMRCSPAARAFMSSCRLGAATSGPTVRSFAKALATRLAKEEPERYVVTLHKAERRGRIFIDYLRNDRGASAIAPYSPRARPGAPVTWPVAWDALDDVAAANVLTLRHARQQLAKGQAWQGYGKPIQGLKLAALRALDLARP